jgi:hypothetical protein
VSEDQDRDSDIPRTGRFQPGRSGNPGGRPPRDLVVQRLTGRRIGAALRLLVDALRGERALILIDATAVEALAWSHVALESAPRPEPPASPPRPPDELAAAIAAQRRRTEAVERFAANWTGLDRSGIELPTVPGWFMGRRRHRTTGEVLDHAEWCQRRDAVVPDETD